jgi:ATP sulfurylase
MRIVGQLERNGNTEQIAFLARDVVHLSHSRLDRLAMPMTPQ